MYRVSHKFWEIFVEAEEYVIPSRKFGKFSVLDIELMFF